MKEGNENLLEGYEQKEECEQTFMREFRRDIVELLVRRGIEISRIALEDGESDCPKGKWLHLYINIRSLLVPFDEDRPQGGWAI